MAVTLHTANRTNRGREGMEYKGKRTEKEREGFYGWAPVAAGTCVASVLGAEMTGEPAAMLPMGCVLAAIEVMPAGK